MWPTMVEPQNGRKDKIPLAPFPGREGAGSCGGQQTDHDAGFLRKSKGPRWEKMEGGF